MTEREGLRLAEATPEFLVQVPHQLPAGDGPVVFVDRDGVINHRRFPFVQRPSQVRMLPAATEGLARLGRLGARVLVVTNQEWVGGRLIRRDELCRIHEALARQVEDAGGRIDGFYAAVAPPWRASAYRKPGDGLLRLASRGSTVDPTACWMVGDNAKDIGAGAAFGARTVLVDARLRTRAQGARARHVCADLDEAARLIGEAHG